MVSKASIFSFPACDAPTTSPADLFTILLNKIFRTLAFEIQFHYLKLSSMAKFSLLDALTLDAATSCAVEAVISRLNHDIILGEITLKLTWQQ